MSRTPPGKRWRQTTNTSLPARGDAGLAAEAHVVGDRRLDDRRRRRATSRGRCPAAWRRAVHCAGRRHRRGACAAVEPGRVHGAVFVDRRRLPAARAGDALGRNRARRRERASAVARLRRADARHAVPLRDPDDGRRRAPLITTRGGCSPLPLASPAMSLTRTGAPKRRPPSSLTAANTSVPARPTPTHAAATAIAVGRERHVRVRSPVDGQLDAARPAAPRRGAAPARCTPPAHRTSSSRPTAAADRASRHQKRPSRRTGQLRGSPTDVGAPKFGDGLAGYAPAPKLPCTVTTLI